VPPHCWQEIRSTRSTWPSPPQTAHATHCVPPQTAHAPGRPVLPGGGETAPGRTGETVPPPGAPGVDGAGARAVDDPRLLLIIGGVLAPLRYINHPI